MQNSSSPAERVDLRVRRTRKLLRDALVSLIDERGFDAISISDIAEHAMINRATFYRHYRDKADLLMHCMDDVFEELQARVVPPVDRAGQPQMQAPSQNFVMVFEHVAEHAAFYRVMLGKDGSSLFHVRVRDLIKGIIRQRIGLIAASLPDLAMPPLEADLLAHFGAASLIGMVTWWVENQMPYPAAHMAEQAILLVTRGAYGIYPLPPDLIANN